MKFTLVECGLLSICFKAFGDASSKIEFTILAFLLYNFCLGDWAKLILVISMYDIGNNILQFYPIYSP